MRAVSIPANGRRSASRSPQAPAVVVGYSMGNGPIPLGLDRPLDLLGGERLAPDGMPMALGIDHFPGLREFIADACRSSFLAAKPFYSQRPLTLLGSQGVGKGFAARWIARAAGLPIFRTSTVAGSMRPCGSMNRGEVRLPALPILAMACSRCANPMVVIELDEDDMIDAETQRHLASMIDRRRNRRWVDGSSDAMFDLSHVSWVIEVQGRKPSVRAGRLVSPAALPEMLGELLEEQGTMLELATPSHLEDLRRLEIALVVCHGEGIREPGVVANVHDAVKAVQPPSTGTRPSQTVLVDEARRVLATLRPGTIA